MKKSLLVINIEEPKPHFSRYHCEEPPLLLYGTTINIIKRGHILLRLLRPSTSSGLAMTEKKKVIARNSPRHCESRFSYCLMDLMNRDEAIFAEL